MEFTPPEYPDNAAVKVGSCFKDKYGYLKQREKDVLFVNKNLCCISTHPIGYLHGENELVEIDEDEFNMILNQFISKID